MELLLPRVREPEPILPSYVKLDMAFGVGSGSTLFDKTRYRSHGAITGAAWAAGAHGYCLDFDKATPSYVEIPAAHTQLDFTPEDFSGIARVRLETLTATAYLISRGSPAAYGWELIIHSAVGLHFQTSQTGASQVSYGSPGDIVAVTWYTIGFSRDGASVKLYKNGVDITNVKGTHINPLTSPAGVKIGIHDDKVTQPIDGKIEFLRIFGGIALAASEHLAWHNALA